MPKNEQLELKNCPEFPHFGAKYPDAICIDGYLWDMDSYDGEGYYSKGGDDPCPFCNKEEYIEWVSLHLTRQEAEIFIERLKNNYKNDLK